MARPGVPSIVLTPQQAEVLSRIARGQQQPGIARDMDITVSTVRTYYRDCLTRLGADNAPHAVALAIGLNLLPTDVATRPLAGGTS